MKKVKSKAMTKALEVRKANDTLIKKILIVSFLVFACLLQNRGFADEEAAPELDLKKNISSECKELIAQMRNLRKEARAKREELMPDGVKPKLELDENGKPIFPPEFQAFIEQKMALKEQLKAAKCPRPPRKGKKGKNRGKKRQAMSDGEELLDNAL